nr:hypothetical protein [Mucilaginibacter sp. L294]
MKSNTGLKSLLIAAGVVIIVLGVKLYLQAHRSAQTNGSASAIIDEAKTAATKIATSVDNKGYAKTTFERKKDIIGNGDISKLPVSQSVLDSLRLDNLDKSKKLQQASYINATLQANELRAVKKIDSLNRVHYEYSDAFANVGFTPDSLGGKFDLKYNIKLIRHDYYSPKKLFKSQVNYTDILSPDKRITIDGLQTLRIESPQPSRLSLGLHAGYDYIPALNRFMPGVGLGLTFTIKSF